jgi:hypothetical protein
MDTGSQAIMLAMIVIRMQLEARGQRLDPMVDLRLEQAFTSDEEIALLISGMSELAEHLLVRLAQATGETTSEILDDISRKVQFREVPLLRTA